MAEKLAAAYGGHAELQDDIYNSVETDPGGQRAQGVFVQDQTTPMLDCYLTLFLNVFTLASDLVVDNFTFEAGAGHLITIGDMVNFAEGDDFSQFEVLNVVTNTITLDAAIDVAYTVAGVTAERADKSMLVDGSSTPVEFSIRPIANMIWDVTRLIIVFESASSMDFTTFGSIAALSRGCLLRIDNTTQNNIFNYKTNGELINRAFDNIFVSKTGGGGFGFTARSSFAGQSKRGVTARLFGDSGDQLQHIIQDDLTSGNTRINVIAQGHVVQN